MSQLPVGLRTWHVDDAGIDLVVITKDLQRYLGPGARLIEPYVAGSGYYCYSAYNALTPAMIVDLKQDSFMWKRGEAPEYDSLAAVQHNNRPPASAPPPHPTSPQGGKWNLEDEDWMFIDIHKSKPANGYKPAEHTPSPSAPWYLNRMNSQSEHITPDPTITLFGNYRAADGSIRHAVSNESKTSSPPPQLRHSAILQPSLSQSFNARIPDQGYRAADGSVRHQLSRVFSDSPPQLIVQTPQLFPLRRSFMSDSNILEDFTGSTSSLSQLGTVSSRHESHPSPMSSLPSVQVPPYSASEGFLQSYDSLSLSYNNTYEVAEACGWEIGKEKFLFHSAPLTKLTTTQRGVLGHGNGVVVKEVVAKGYSITMARKRILTPIHMKPSERKRERDRIISEIDNLRALRHPHIVSILGCYQEPHKYRYSILMYPVGDEDLHKCFHEVSSEIAEGLPAPRTWVMRNWFHCLLSALAYIHSCNMRHDDIKPRNIIHRGGHVFFTDFGSSKKIVDSNHTTTESLASATRLYAAPEALRDLQTNEVSSHGRKSDVYSLGLVFAEMDTLIAGATLPQLHAFLERESGGKFQQNPKPGEIPEYHRVAYLLGSWFFEIGVPKVYIDLIAPMLREVRDERVSAHAHSCTLSSLLQPSSCHPDCEWWRKGPI